MYWPSVVILLLVSEPPDKSHTLSIDVHSQYPSTTNINIFYLCAQIFICQDVVLENVLTNFFYVPKISFLVSVYISQNPILSFFVIFGKLGSIYLLERLVLLQINLSDSIYVQFYSIFNSEFSMHDCLQGNQSQKGAIIQRFCKVWPSYFLVGY